MASLFVPLGVLTTVEVAVSIIGLFRVGISRCNERSSQSFIFFCSRECSAPNLQMPHSPAA